MHDQIKELGGSLIAISPQQQKYSKQIVNKHKLTFPVLVDTDNTVATQFGLTFSLPESLIEIYSGFGIDLVRFNDNESWTLPMSGRFIIDGKGIIRNVEVHPDYTQRPDPSEIIGILQSLL